TTKGKAGFGGGETWRRSMSKGRINLTVKNMSQGLENLTEKEKAGFGRAEKHGAEKACRKGVDKPDNKEHVARVGKPDSKRESGFRRWRNMAQKHVKGADKPDSKEHVARVGKPDSKGKAGFGGGETWRRSMSKGRINPTAKNMSQG
ncbi:hypothetical protein KI387_036669, partial [Taxus chinensis]